MKSKLVIVALFCLTSFMSLSYGQKRETDIPVVIDTKKDYGQGKSRICLSYPGIEDTLIVYPHIRVDFEYPLSDVSKPIVVRMLFHLDHKENEKLWNFLDAKVTVWYRNQPYEDVIARAGIDTTAFWGPRIYLSPEK